MTWRHQHAHAGQPSLWRVDRGQGYQHAALQRSDAMQRHDISAALAPLLRRHITAQHVQHVAARVVYQHARNPGRRRDGALVEQLDGGRVVAHGEARRTQLDHRTRRHLETGERDQLLHLGRIEPESDVVFTGHRHQSHHVTHECSHHRFGIAQPFYRRDPMPFKKPHRAAKGHRTRAQRVGNAAFGE